MRSSSSNRSSKLFLLATAGLAATTLSSTALAQTLSWNNIAGGAASTASNWSPVQVPTSASLLVWNLSNTFTTTFSSAVPLSTSHTFKRGLVTLSFSSPHSTSGAVHVAEVSGDSVTAVVTAGTLHAGSGVIVGNSSGAIGTLTVDNEGAFVDTTAAGSDIVIGNSGTGTLNITDGALVQPIDDLVIGSAGTGVGTVTVTGTGALPLPIPSSTLNLPNAGQDITVGSLGSGTLNVTGGGRVVCDEMFVSLSPGSDGTVNVSGIGGLLNANSTIQIATSLHLGDNPGIGLTSGSASLTVNDGGVVNVVGTTRIGDANGVGSGTLTVNSGGEFSTGALIATDTGGFLNLLGGRCLINGGSLTLRNDVLTFGEAGSSPILILNDGAACTLSNAVAPFEALIVGNGGHATFSVFTGSHLTISSGDAILGNLAAGNGQLNIRDAGTLVSMPASRFLVIGDAGVGQVILQSGAHLVTGTVNLGRTATGVGTAEVTQNGSVWDITGSLAIGGTASAAFGTGTVTVGGIGVGGNTLNIVSGGPGTTSARVWAAGDSLTVTQGGILNTDGDVLITGAFTLAGGEVRTNRLQLNTAATNFNLNGSLFGPLQLLSANSTITLTGDLSIDSGFANLNTIINNGFIEIGDHALSLAGATGGNDRSIDNCHLGVGGRLVAAIPVTISPGHTLSGSGMVDAPLNNNGAIVAQGAGLVFNQVVTGVGTGISGTALQFTSSGGLRGAGSVTVADINAAFGSLIAATGNLQLCSTAPGSNFNSQGTVAVQGPFTLTLRGSSGPTITNVSFPVEVMSPSPQLLASSGQLNQSASGRITGSGTLDGGVFQGRLFPGGQTTPGVITLLGASTFTPTTIVQIDVQRLTHSGRIVGPLLGSTALDGTILVTYAHTYVPTLGETHQVYSGNYSGTFAQLASPPGWRVVYEPFNITAFFCPADVNSDGTVDFFDYLDFVDALSAGSENADFNSDSVVDFFDYLDFVDAFSIGC